MDEIDVKHTVSWGNLAIFKMRMDEQMKHINALLAYSYGIKDARGLNESNWLSNSARAIELTATNAYLAIVPDKEDPRTFISQETPNG